jgi:pilus assembly protein Flp/PilA
VNKTLIARFLDDDTGATAIEYGLIAALISVAIIGAATTMGTKLSSTFATVSGQLK